MIVISNILYAEILLIKINVAKDKNKKKTQFKLDQSIKKILYFLMQPSSWNLLPEMVKH